MTSAAVWDAVLRLVGAFYVFAGFVALRATLLSVVIDRGLARITLEPPQRAETMKALWLGLGSAVIFLGGLSLMLVWEGAPWLFLLSAAGQAIYLYALAPLYFDRVDAPEASGRRGTTNAFVIFVGATALVFWAKASGRLVAADALPVWQVAAALAAAAACGVWAVRHLR